MKVQLKYLGIAWKNRNVLLVFVDMGRLRSWYLPEEVPVGKFLNATLDVHDRLSPRSRLNVHLIKLS